MGHGWAPAVTAIEYNVPIGLSSDVATTASADQFTQMHAVFGSERARKHQAAWDSDLDGLHRIARADHGRERRSSGERIGGAEVAGIADRTGSLTPGKQADIVIIDGKAVNVAPIIDPVGAVVCAADISNVKTVMVGGELLKEDFKLKASLDEPRKAVEASKDYLLGAFGDPEPGWILSRRLRADDARAVSEQLGQRGHVLSDRGLPPPPPLRSPDPLPPGPSARRPRRPARPSAPVLRYQVEPKATGVSPGCSNASACSARTGPPSRSPRRRRRPRRGRPRPLGEHERLGQRLVEARAPPR